MDLGVFLAWIGTLLACVLCVVYGLYHQFIKKSDEKRRISSKKDQDNKQEEDL
jgi:predicted outer membrane lipoprotein